MGRSSTALAVVIATVMAVPAAAQFGNIFGPFGTPPWQQQQQPQQQRPPAPVPGGRQAMPSPGPGNVAPPSGGYGGIQSQPLPPPGAYEPPPRREAPPQRAQRIVPPSDAPPGDDVAPDVPTPRIVNTAALFTGLDKITGRIINFDVAIGETVQFGALQLTPRACYSRPASEATKPDAFVEVDEVTLQGEVRRIFTGWMYAASPGLHGVEHSIYDLWLTDCKSPTVAAEKTPDPPAPAARAQQTQPKQQPQQQRRTPPPATPLNPR
jgi:hypothetical protein